MGSPCFVPRKNNGSAFTLVEVMVGCAVLLLLLVMLFSMTSQTTSIVSAASARIDAFESARTAFDTISQRLSQATMNTYWDYYNTSNQRLNPSATSGPTAPVNFLPANYGRASDLHFVIQANPNSGQAVFFAAPESVSANTTIDQTRGLLNAIGYYVDYISDSSFAPGVITSNRYRYRLMQCNQPTENFMLYSLAGTDWIPAVKSTAWPLADNVIALIVWPRQPVEQDTNGTNITSNYLYNSRDMTSAVPGVFPIQYAQAPPSVQLTMVAIDEASAVRLSSSGSNQPQVISSALQDSPFVNVTQYQADITSLQSALSARHVNYRVFTSTINLRESKWNAQ